MNKSPKPVETLKINLPKKKAAFFYHGWYGFPGRVEGDRGIRSGGNDVLLGPGSSHDSPSGAEGWGETDRWMELAMEDIAGWFP